MAWLSGWSYRKEISITGQSGAGTDFQVDFNIGDSAGGDFHLEGHCTNFPQDIEVTDNDGTTLLKFWIEDITADPLKMWVKVADDLGSNQTIYVYYGKSGASTNSDGANTFNMFDDFSYADIVTNHGWASIQGTAPTPSSGKITIDNNWIYHSSNTFGQNYVMRAYGKMSATTVLQEWGFSDLTSDPPSHDIQNSQYSVSMLAHSTNTMYIANYGAAITQVDGGSYTAVYNTFEIVRNGSTNTQFTHDGVAYNNSPISTNVPSQDMYVHLLDYASSSGSSEWDWVLVRKYIANEPAFSSAGSEETPPIGAAPTAVFYGPLVGPLGGPI